ncbi:MAG: histidine kinase [Burkholderiales bacterium]|nr:histidine kinase [Burkholderiales bacterium]
MSPPIPRLSVAHMVAATIALNCAIAAALTAFGTAPLVHNLVFSQCIGLATYALIDLPRRRLWPAGAPRVLPMAGLVLAGSLGGWFVGSVAGGALLGLPGQPLALSTTAAAGFIVLTAAAGFAGTFYFWTRERIAAGEQRAAEAQLRLLTAQIEPHFLFNTLANLQALIAVDPARAQAMLAHLDAWLRSTLAASRSHSTTLDDEFRLLRDYLEILAIRMGARLTYRLDLPIALARLPVPPMLLQPLVENAVRHGLEPRIEGGAVTVSAREEGRQLVLTVADTGLGLAPGTATTAGTGVGVGHVRERLAALYGPAASAELADHPDGGAVATLRLPMPA